MEPGSPEPKVVLHLPETRRDWPRPIQAFIVVALILYADALRRMLAWGFKRLLR